MSKFVKCDTCGAEMKDGDPGTNGKPHQIRIQPVVQSTGVGLASHIEIVGILGENGKNHGSADVCLTCVLRSVGREANVHGVKAAV